MRQKLISVNWSLLYSNHPLVDSENMQTEPGTLIVKEMNSKKVKPSTGTLTGAEDAEVRRTEVDLARVEPGMATGWEPMYMEANKKGEAIAAAKREKHRHNKQARKRQWKFAGK